jgi:hypothetical protein
MLTVERTRTEMLSEGVDMWGEMGGRELQICEARDVVSPEHGVTTDQIWSV